MSIDVSEKLKLIRESERLNRKEFSELTGVAYSSLSSYESRSKNAGVEAIMKVLQHPRFTKYTLWFMTDQVAPEAGQIAPALAHFGQNETTSPHSGQKDWLTIYREYIHHKCLLLVAKFQPPRKKRLVVAKKSTTRRVF